MTFRLQHFFAVCLIVLAAVIAYSNSFSGPFVFDDGYATTNNPSIRHLWPIWQTLSPPANLTVGGRPLLNLTFAINYAFSGLEVRSYHTVNLAIHILAGLTLFGIMRRTLQRPILRERFGVEALSLALAVALLWIVHPLQTEAVSYVSQRAESLMGLFYLLTIYCLIRSTESPNNKRFWSILCVVACLPGMATKEVMITAPLMALIYDRTFLAGTFREAWQQRWRLHTGLMATWLLLCYSLPDVEKRSVGAGLGVTPWSYALTQCGAIIHYLTLAAWPHPLVIDYGTKPVSDAWEVAPQALILLALLAITVVAFVRWPVIGFSGVWFFVILAPTSTVIPIVFELTAEHRMYLPLAALVTVLVLGLHTLLGKGSRFVFLALVIVWGTLTFLRNEDYRTDLALWQQTVSARPDNSRARNNYGERLLAAGEISEAIEQFKQALDLKPGYAEAENNWGDALAQNGQVAEAIGHFQKAALLKPDDAAPQNNLANALGQAGRFPEALDHYREAVRINPDYAEAHSNWGNLLLRMGRVSEAVAQFEETARIQPDNPEAHNNLGVVLAQLGRKQEAVAEFQKALRLDPSYTPASTNLDALRKSVR